MRRDVPRYSETFVYKEITLADLKALEVAVQHRFGANMHCAEFKAVEPQRIKQTFGATWKEFERVFQEHLPELRRYTFYFYPGKADTGRARDRVQFELAVVRRSKFGDVDEAARRITLDGLGCYQHDFDEFVATATHALGLQRPPLAPPAGMDWDDVAIKERSQSIRNPDLKNAVAGAMSGCRYEQAMQNAVILVESMLRHKCMIAGRSEAQVATGSELAVIAYHPDTGCLRPPWSVATNATQGAMQLFMGFVLYLRNAFGHHSVVMGGDKSCVMELLGFCEFLLAVIHKSDLRS